MSLEQELRAIEEVARSPEFSWEDGGEDVLSYDDVDDEEFAEGDIFYGDDDEDFYALGTGAKSPTGTTYGLRVVNANVSTTKTVQLFGYVGSQYSDGDITITAHTGYGAYAMYNSFVLSNPMEVVGLRVQSTEAQINQMSYKWVKSGVFGKTDQNVISLTAYRTEKDYLTGTISCPLRHTLCFDAYVEFSVLASTTVDLIYFIGVRRELVKSVQKRASRPVLPGKTGRIAIGRQRTRRLRRRIR